MNSRYATYLSCTIMMLFGMVLAITSPMLIELSKEFHLSMSQTGLIFAVNFIGFIIFVLSSGFLADKYGKKQVISIAICGFSISLFLFTLSSNFMAALIFTFLIGGFGGIIECMVSALVAELNPDNTSYYINMSQVFLCIGALIGPVMGGMIISAGMGWRLSYYILSAISVVSAIIFIRTRIHCVSGQDAIRFDDFKKLLTNGKFLVVCLCMFLYTGSEVGAWGWMSTFLERQMHFSLNKSSVIVGLFWITMLAGRLLCGNLSSKYSLKILVITLSIASSAVTIISGFLSSELLMWVIVGFMGFAYSSLYPFIVSFGSENAPVSSSTTFSLLVASGSLGTVLIPYSMGVVGEFISIRASMVFPGLMLLVLALIFITLKEKAQKSAINTFQAETGV